MLFVMSSAGDVAIGFCIRLRMLWPSYCYVIRVFIMPASYASRALQVPVPTVPLRSQRRWLCLGRQQQAWAGLFQVKAQDILSINKSLLRLGYAGVLRMRQLGASRGG
jgi:hypothetical protein